MHLFEWALLSLWLLPHPLWLHVRCRRYWHKPQNRVGGASYVIYTFFITGKAFVFRIAHGFVRNFFKVQWKSGLFHYKVNSFVIILLQRTPLGLQYIREQSQIIRTFRTHKYNDQICMYSLRCVLCRNQTKYSLKTVSVRNTPSCHAF
jgi:hypothetical protein